LTISVNQPNFCYFSILFRQFQTKYEDQHFLTLYLSYANILSTHTYGLMEA
jgi:hypothetical protein